MAKPTAASEKKHRRQTFWQVKVPALAGILFLLGILLVAIVLPLRSQSGLIADFSLTVLVLCPVALCLFPLFLGLVAANVGLSRLNTALANLLVRAETMSHTMVDKANTASETISRKTTAFRSRVDTVEQAVNRFEHERGENDDAS